MLGIVNVESIFPLQYMRAAIMVSLLSVWVLVLLFYYLNRYTKRYYFLIWTVGWLFYAVWLTMGWQLDQDQIDPMTIPGALRLCCIGLSATFLLWGSLSFLSQPTPQFLFALFIVFLVIWAMTARFAVEDRLIYQLPVFILNGLASIFAGLSFYRARSRHQFIGIGMLCLGFTLWGLYLFSYPFTLTFQSLAVPAFFFSAVLQLFIAVSMIVLVLEDARQRNQQILEQIRTVNTEKEELQLQVVNTEKQYRSLMDQARLTQNLQQAYDDLRQTQENIMQLERLRALGQMASGIAHDINNALSPITMLPDMILTGEQNLTETTRTRLEGIRTAGEDISQIVARLRQFYRRDHKMETFAAVDLNRLAEQVLKLTQPRWRDMPQQQGVVVQVETHFENELPPVRGSESEIREALINLVLNAVDAMPQGGTLSIATRSVSGKVRADQAEGPSHIWIEIRDSGVGMDEHTVRHCLDPFFTTKQSHGGTGLGLAMVYGTMERHEGNVQIQSQPGQGTTVRLIFLPSPVAEEPAAPVSQEDIETTPLHILCVDDEPLLRSLLKELLETLQHKVEVADGGEQGIAAFNEAHARGEPFDVVITDLGMPLVDGRQVARAIKTNSPETAVILLTGWGLMFDGMDVSPHVDEVLSKPPRLAELTRSLERIARGKTAKSGAQA